MTTPASSVSNADGLDDLTPAERDALPFGLVQVDGSGRVTVYNGAQAAMSGVAAADALGRDFFREVLPAANLPHFGGRFREGVRRARVDEDFEFILGADPQPLRIAVSMRGARQPGRYWIALTQIERLPARRERAAQAAIGRRARSEPIDPNVCEREPIHIPGSIQPHALLIATDLEHLVVTVCSANVAELLGTAPSAVVGRDLADILPARFVELLRSRIATGAIDAVRHVRRTVRLAIGDGRPFLAQAHVHSGRLLVELELAPAHPEDFEQASQLDVEDAIARLREVDTLAEAARIAAREIRMLTGFECVLVYRFDKDWNGEAVAEDMVDDWERPFVGLRFPASDIPAQARALYTKAKSRFVIDRDAVPVPLAASPASGNEAVDLTYAQARSLSPIHLEYQRNMGVNGSMSVSILVEGQLWGLMIGHHRRPHYVAPETRAAANVLTEAFALRLTEIESRRLRTQQTHHLAVETALLRQMAAGDDFVEALTAGPRTILDLFNATGAAIVSDRTVRTLGTAPPEGAIRDLVGWLRETVPADDRSYATDELPARYGPDWAHADVASGVLAAFLDAARQHAVLWFRAETASTVTWGGDPRKAVIGSDSAGMVLPRRSFERWVEERRGLSAPWADWQRAIGETLAEAVEGVSLRQRQKIIELTGLLEDKEKLLVQKDLLTREIDHRVKNSLQIVSAFLNMQRRQAKDPEASAAFAETAARVMSVARVHDSLYQAESVEEVDLGQTIAALCKDLAGMAGDEHALDLRADARLMVPYRKAVALCLIATELVTNAFKYAYMPGQGGRVEVVVRGSDDGGVALTVQDEGRGLPESWAANAQGTGLGMKLVRAMLDQIGARLDVATAAGARFTVHA